MSADLQERLKQIIDAVAVQWDMSPFGERPRADLLQRLMHVFKYEQSQHYNEMKDLQRKIYALQSDLAAARAELADWKKLHAESQDHALYLQKEINRRDQFLTELRRELDALRAELMAELEAQLKDGGE